MSIKSFKQFFEADAEEYKEKEGPKKDELEPRVKGEKKFKDDHKVEVTDRPDSVKQDGADGVKKTPARKGDK